MGEKKIQPLTTVQFKQGVFPHIQRKTHLYTLNMYVYIEFHFTFLFFHPFTAISMYYVRIFTVTRIGKCKKFNYLNIIINYCIL